MAFQEPTVRRNGHRIYVRDYPGEGNPILLMHGFPDNLHLYDRVVPHLAPTRRVVTFDFLGWGESDKPASYRTTARKQLHEVETVIDQLGLEDPVLVAHDASGPPGIDWALLHPDRVGALVLLNTYYQWTPSLRRPGAIALYSTPVVRGLARAITRRSDHVDRWLYFWQVGRFIRDSEVRAEVVPRFHSDFRAERPAFWALNNDLLPTMISRRRMIPKMRVRPTGTDRLRLCRPIPEQASRQEVPRPVPDLGAVPAPRRQLSGVVIATRHFVVPGRANDRARSGPKLVWLNVNAIATVAQGPHAGSPIQGSSDESVSLEGSYGRDIAAGQRIRPIAGRATTGEPA